MALTIEEKLEKLKAYKDWNKFTPPQQKFLQNMAQGMLSEDAYSDAYPDTRQVALLPQTAQMLSRAGIRKALDSIGIDVSKPLVSQKEAMELLSKHLRKADDPSVLVKLLSTYAKIAGWDKKTDKDDEPPSLDKLVAAVEKKRKYVKKETESELGEERVI